MTKANSQRFEIMNSEKAISLGLVSQPKLEPDYSWSLVVENLPDGTKRVVGQDGGEPEDQTLSRDWAWVVPALNAAFESGRHSKESR